MDRRPNCFLKGGSYSISKETNSNGSPYPLYPLWIHEVFSGEPCADRIEKSVPRDHHSASSLGKPRDVIGDPRDGFFLPTLRWIIIHVVCTNMAVAALGVKLTRKFYSVKEKPGFRVGSECAADFERANISVLTYLMT